jgi:hypothetical protein
VHRQPGIAERLQLEFRIIHRKRQHRMIERPARKRPRESGCETLTGQGVVSIASAARQVHGPAKPTVSKEAITLIGLNPKRPAALSDIRQTIPANATGAGP